MFDATEIRNLAAQKQLLVAESELNRQALKGEVDRLKANAGNLSRLVPGRSAMLLLAPLAGFLVSSNSAKPVKGFLKKLVVGWQLFRIGKRLVSAFTSPAGGPGDAPAAPRGQS